METQASLIRSDCVVELYAISCIGLDFTVVIDPGYLECENPVRLDDTLYDPGRLEFRMPVPYLAWRRAIISFVFIIYGY